MEVLGLTLVAYLARRGLLGPMALRAPRARRGLLELTGLMEQTARMALRAPRARRGLLELTGLMEQTVRTGQTARMALRAHRDPPDPCP